MADVAEPKEKGPDALSTYRGKRDFSKTAEPQGGGSRGGDSFVVQKHDASRLHFDFRLELDGVLKSWAVTRGPSLDPEDKRLAVRTEDHPLDYAEFEGTIPKGEYGGGTVMLWDNGRWEPAPGKDPHKTLEEGHLHFTLYGQRMKGDWLLIRLKPRAKEKAENWILRKINDQYAGGSDDLVGKELTSISTGRAMAEIASGKSRVWHSKAVQAKLDAEAASTAAGAAAPQDTAAAKKPARSSRAKKAKIPEFRSVQLATLVDHVPTGNAWLHEIKHDGYRALLCVGDGEARAYTRSGLDWSDKFAPVVTAAAALPVQSAQIDGEVVVLDGDGKSSFQALQASLKEGSLPLTFMAFDLLSLDGEDLTGTPLMERKAKLETLIGTGRGPIRYSDHVRGEGEKLFQSMCAHGVEGVVSKRADSPYVGARTGTWLKIKCLHRQEFVIVGWTPSDKARGFRSLLLGVNADGELRYVGKVGTGFNADEIDRLLARMQPLEQTDATVKAPRAAVRGAHWIRPELVAEIAYTELTDEGVLRHPSYLGLREDKKAEAVVMETKKMVAEAESAPPAPASSDAADVQGEGPAAQAATPNPASLVAPSVKITNPDRVVFPESRITKGELVDYYRTVAPVMLPWIASRPISLVRCPQGRAKQCFFQKHDAGSFGEAVKHVPIREKDGHVEPYLYIDDAEGLITCVQMGVIEFHGWGARVEDVEKADRLVFDLDPDEEIGWETVVNAAFHVRDKLGEMGLATFPMVTGGKGVHVIAPLTPEAEWPEVKDFAHLFARVLEAMEPERFISVMSKEKRRGRIFVDYLRNQRGATAVMPYGLRARPQAPVAAPLSWEELRTIGGANRFHVGDAQKLVERAGSRALKGWGQAKQKLPKV